MMVTRVYEQMNEGSMNRLATVYVPSLGDERPGRFVYAQVKALVGPLLQRGLGYFGPWTMSYARHAEWHTRTPGYVVYAGGRTRATWKTRLEVWIA